MTRIFDNISVDLGPHLLETLAVSHRLDAAVGYFNLRGWKMFAPLVEARPPGDAPVARVLVGMATGGSADAVIKHLQATVDGEPEVEEIDNSTAKDRRRRVIENFRLQLMRGVPNEDDLQALQALRSHLADGRVQIRLFTRRPLHGKTYICHREDLNNPITAFVGSSNLTMSGLRHNYELNVDVLDHQGTERLAEWFEDRWDDRYCLDISEDLLEVLDESWAANDTPTPYEVYLKICWHLSRDVREGLVEYSIPNLLREQLLEYQGSAVKTLTRRIVTRGGTMLGDVVGLGKTITAIAVASMLREDYGYDTLVVCPKNLVGMWQAYLDNYELPGRVVAYSMAGKVLPSLRRYRFVVVDESHTLRNDTRQDYKALKEYVRRNDSKVLLLTATPFNIRFRDVANQIGLYLEDDEDLGLQPLAALIKDPGLVDRVDGRVTTLAAFRKSEEPDDWKRLMSDHLVRRTRSFVKANYALKDGGREYLVFSNGERFFFPTRTAHPVAHSFGTGDKASIMASNRTLDTIDRLRLPRYALANYLDPKQKLSAQELELVERLRRARGHLSGFVRTGLFKRLSSCGFSFTLSLQRHLARNRLWLYALENHLDVPVGTVLDAMLDSPDGDLSSAETDEDPDAASPLLSDPASDYAALSGRRTKSLSWARPELFSAALVRDLRADADALEALLVSFGEWDWQQDSKMAALGDLLLKKHPREKVLIFTEYKDTAKYVHETLLAMGVLDAEVVTGDSGDPTAVARRFSPMSNANVGQVALAEKDQIRVLVSTDVLSEGQNLQDAHIVVNYDLPWAIIRLIQRAGRVDRVGQKNDRVRVYSFFHEDVENVLNLRQRIRDRLERNAQVFGSDEKFFGTAEETQVIEGLYNGTLPDEEEDAENDASSVAYEIWMRAKEEDQDRAARVEALPDLVYATRPTRAGEGEAVGVYIRTERGLDGFGFGSTAGALTLFTGQEALRFFACSPTTNSLERLAGHFTLVQSLVQGPLRQPDVREGRLRGVRARIWKRLSGSLIGSAVEVAAALDDLYRRPLTAEAEQKLKNALAAGRDDEQLCELLSVLHADERLVVADSSGSDPVRIVCSMGSRTS